MQRSGEDRVDDDCVRCGVCIHCLIGSQILFVKTDTSKMFLKCLVPKIISSLSSASAKTPNIHIVLSHCWCHSENSGRGYRYTQVSR